MKPIRILIIVAWTCSILALVFSLYAFYAAHTRYSGGLMRTPSQVDSLEERR